MVSAGVEAQAGRRVAQGLRRLQRSMHLVGACRSPACATMGVATARPQAMLFTHPTPHPPPPPTQPPTHPTPLQMFYKAARVEYVPVGVVGAIVPWNYPFHNIFNPLTAALFAGNAIVIKVRRSTGAARALHQGSCHARGCASMASLPVSPNTTCIPPLSCPPMRPPKPPSTTPQVSEHASWSAVYYKRIIDAALAAAGAPADLVQVRALLGCSQAGRGCRLLPPFLHAALHVGVSRSGFPGCWACCSASLLAHSRRRFPPQIVTGYGEAGNALVTSPDVGKIIFVGSTHIGRKVRAQLQWWHLPAPPAAGVVSGRSCWRVVVLIDSMRH